jgi:hypothetical protein
MHIKSQMLFIGTFLFLSLSKIYSIEDDAPSGDKSLIHLYDTMTPLQEAKLLSLQSSFDERNKKQEELQRVMEASRVDQRPADPAPQVEDLQLQLELIRAQLESLRPVIDERAKTIANMTRYEGVTELSEMGRKGFENILERSLNENKIDEDTYKILLAEEERLDRALSEARRVSEGRLSPLVAAAPGPSLLSSAVRKPKSDGDVK